jgi:hypothetical protein
MLLVVSPIFNTELGVLIAGLLKTFGVYVGGISVSGGTTFLNFGLLFIGGIALNFLLNSI